MELDAYDIMVLEQIGEANKCELLLPPAGKVMEPFYCIRGIMNDAIALRKLLVDIHDADFSFRYDGKDDEKDLIVITGCVERDEQ